VSEIEIHVDVVRQRKKGRNGNWKMGWDGWYGILFESFVTSVLLSANVRLVVFLGGLSRLIHL